MFWVFFCETQARLAQILRTILMLRMQEMAFPGFKFQKFSGGGCPRTPLLGVAYGHACGLRPQCYGRILWLDPPLPTVMYMHGVVVRIEFVTFFKIFASHQKNGTVELFKLFLLGVFTSQLFKTADNSDNVLKHNIFFSSP